MTEMPSCSNEIFPFLAMILVECCEMGMITLGKAAMNEGLSNLVYVVYYNALGTLLLLPFLIFHRFRSNITSITLSILWRFFLLGLLGYVKNCFFLCSCSLFMFPSARVLLKTVFLQGRGKTRPTWCDSLPSCCYCYVPKVLVILVENWSFTCKICGRICLVQAIAYTGIKFSSPALAAALGNLMPGFTFLLAIIFRMETLDLRKASSQAKSVGTIVAIAGASIMTLYKGPRILGSTFPTDSPHHSLLSRESNWILGGLLITTTCIMSSGWNILQTDTVKKYPENMTIVFFTCCFGSIQCAILTLALERNPNAWMLKPGVGLIAIVFSAVSGSVFRYNVLTWCLDKKGPLYVAMFKPLGMVIAAILGILFLADSLHLGSVIGAIIITAGFYSVLWGKAKEKSIVEVEDIVCEIDSSNQRSPLLQK